MERSVVIAGLGFISSIGNDAAEVAGSVRELRGGIEALTFFDNPDLLVKVAGTIKGFKTDSVSAQAWSYPARYSIRGEALRALAPNGLYALCAMTQAVEDSRLSPEMLGDAKTGLFCASAGSSFLLGHYVNQLQQRRGQRCDPMGVVRTVAGTLNFNLAAYFQMKGAVCGFATACASSAHAMGYAWDEIRLGRQERMVVVGAEDANAESIVPFDSMRALTHSEDPARASRPFDVKRDGFVGSGGAAAVVLEEEGSARSRGAPIYARLTGWGQAADGYNVAIAHPEGHGLRRAMEQALACAGAAPESIDYVNAHATSTPAGDRAEALALGEVFTKRGAHPWVSSTKALTGHTLSMAGALETGICALAIREGFLPGAANLEEPDPACEGLRFPRQTLSTRPKRVLKNSSGFGGANVCLVLEAVE